MAKRMNFYLSDQEVEKLKKLSNEPDSPPPRS